MAVERAPFRLAFSSGPSPLLAQRTGGSLGYRTGDGVLHRLTALTAETGAPGVRSVYSRRDRRAGPDRDASRSPRPTPARSVDVALSPAAGVAEVREAFDGSPDEHFLGGGERPGYVDLRGQAPSLAVSVNCAPAPAPFFLSLGRLRRLRPRRRARALRLPGGARRRAARAARCAIDFAACSIAPAPGQTQLCSQAASLAYDVYAGAPAAVMRAYTAAAGRAPVPPPSELALIKWRDEVDGPGEVLDDIAQLQAAGSRSAGCCSTTRGRPVHRPARVRPGRIPDPGRA